MLSLVAPPPVDDTSRDPARSVSHRIVRDYLQTFRAGAAQWAERGDKIPVEPLTLPVAAGVGLIAAGAVVSRLHRDSRQDSLQGC